jgi:two-component system sensor histidine kinase BaeS
VTGALAAWGWVCALLACWRVLALSRRLELVACAEHELRGPLTALTLAAARSGPVESRVVEGQLERARVALADLTAARSGRRAAAIARRHELSEVAERAAAGWAGAGADVSVEWRAGPVAVDADPARISQALGNLLSNALEHGGGRAELRGVRSGEQVRVEIADRGPGLSGRRSRLRQALRRRSERGRGLAIAARAVEDAGGRLALSSGPDGTVAAFELPLDDS